MTKEIVAEVDIRNLDTGSIRTRRITSLKEASRLRVGMMVNPRENIDDIWLFPQTLGRDYQKNSMKAWSSGGGIQ